MLSLEKKLELVENIRKEILGKKMKITENYWKNKKSAKV
jgi:hypothetical protein